MAWIGLIDEIEQVIKPVCNVSDQRTERGDVQAERQVRIPGEDLINNRDECSLTLPPCGSCGYEYILS